jgi:hypothetical protein
VTLYALQRSMYERVRNGDRSITPSSELDEAEREALAEDDVAALFGLGVHPVLLNGYCRLIGLNRDSYRAMLAGALGDGPEVEVPWRSS